MSLYLEEIEKAKLGTQIKKTHHHLSRNQPASMKSYRHNLFLLRIRNCPLFTCHRATFPISRHSDCNSSNCPRAQVLSYITVVGWFVLLIKSPITTLAFLHFADGYLGQQLNLSRNVLLQIIKFRKMSCDN